MLGGPLGAALRGGRQISYSAEATALFARMSVPPDATRKALIDALIVALKVSGVWTKLDAFYLLAAHDAQAARLNWASTSYNLTAVNSPTFTTDRGYTGNGSTNYLDSAFDPTTAPSAKYTQNDAHMGVWCGTDVSSSIMVDLGNTRGWIIGRLTTTLRYNPVTGSTISATLAASTSIGHSSWVRTASAAYEAFKNGASVGTGTGVSSAPVSAPHYLLARGDVGPVASNFSSRRVQAAHWGGKLTAGEIAALYAAVSIYMTAVGA